MESSIYTLHKEQALYDTHPFIFSAYTCNCNRDALHHMVPQRAGAVYDTAKTRRITKINAHRPRRSRLNDQALPSQCSRSATIAMTCILFSSSYYAFSLSFLTYSHCYRGFLFKRIRMTWELLIDDYARFNTRCLGCIYYISLPFALHKPARCPLGQRPCQYHPLTQWLLSLGV